MLLGLLKLLYFILCGGIHKQCEKLRGWRIVQMTTELDTVKVSTKGEGVKNIHVIYGWPLVCAWMKVVKCRPMKRMDIKMRKYPHFISLPKIWVHVLKIWILTIQLSSNEKVSRFYSDWFLLWSLSTYFSIYISKKFYVKPRTQHLNCMYGVRNLEMAIRFSL